MDNDRIEGAARNIGGKVESAAGDLLGDNKTKTDGLMDQVAGQAQNAFGSVKDTARQVANDAPKYLDDAIDNGQRYYRQGSQAVREQFGNVPVTEIMLAGAAGYLLAWLIHGRQ
ncbi:CsbD family protein [Lichenihabitans psoromatis]|uniref:CsbD family protein n=1 Tax=Lichenihabitans psoromatis TaxID=2528642 RepID=UPI0010383B6E|nr:CsbD family protein [Lichenihabitans psoromatis]